MKQCLLLLFFFTNVLVFGQGEANVWYFGNKAGIDFNSGAPVPLTNGQLNTLEGCATMSDAQGNILFYTNGSKVYNKNHVVMDNGTGLFGDVSSSQSAIILQKPNSSTKFYIFTTNAFSTNGGFRYSEVDMSANGNTGAVTSKNILLSASTCEKISIVKHANGHDFWVVTHLWNSNGFLSHLVTSNGISGTPVLSNSGLSVAGDEDRANAIGYMKISPDGTKLAVCHTYLKKAEIFDFNNQNGHISNPKLVSNEGNHVYGVAFSPNSNVLYISAVDEKKLFRYNLNAENITDSQVLLTSFATLPGALELAPDGKIYIAMAETSRLSVINNTDNTGSGCNVQANAVDLNGRICMLGLPSSNQSQFNTSIIVQNRCLGDASSFTLHTSHPVQTAFWDFGDNTTASGLNPTHVYATPGNYTVTVTAGNSLFTLSRTKSITVSAAPVAHTIANQALCIAENEQYQMVKHDIALLGGQSAAQFRTSYFETLEDAEDNQNEIAGGYLLPGGTIDIYAKVTNIQTGCDAITSFTLTSASAPNLGFISDFEICDDGRKDGITTFDLTEKDAEILNGLGNSFAVSYHESSLEAEENQNSISGLYENTSNGQVIFVRVENTQTGCFAIAEFKLVVKSDCKPEEIPFKYPKFFTPNGDGHNDVWELKSMPDNMQIHIFDRYGKLIRSINSQTNGWDGTIQGNPLPADDYWFVVTGKNIPEQRGHFALKR